ncbi:dihydrodipicolinate synthase family protein [Marispirochaeta sp.]|uniref:dihydrodipicolinate synthase family protein n=1 Tax=Marispirochaeta sp. TaxID=2038653 RepID=UPI0029C89D4A|nr:dihydrodipicolinate synthase family protein [Marispirochaeta sp.]
MYQPKGIIPAMLSVFNKDGSIDIQGQKAYVEWLIKKGVHGLSPVGSTGEGAAMNDEERLQVIKATVEQANGRVPVVAGVIHYSTMLGVDLAKSAIDAGADALMVLLPYYYKPTIPDALDYLRSVSKAVNMPLCVYNNPWFAGFELSPALVKQLADEGVVNSIKAAHGDPMRVNYIKYLCGEKVSTLYGHDYSPLEAFAVGGDGWLSGLPNIIPDLAVDLFTAATQDKDLVKAQAIWKRLQPIAYYFMYERVGDNASPHWLAVFKEALRLMGEDFGLPRLPTKEMSPADKKVLQRYLYQVYPDVVKAQ